MPDAAALRAAAATAAAVLLVHLLLILPNHPGAMTPEALLRVPLELPVLLILLVLAPRAARLPVTALLLAMAVVKLADLATSIAFLRPFNPFLDLHLARSGWELVGGILGPLPALAVVAALVAAAVTATWWATGCIARLPLGSRRGALVALALPALALVAADATLQSRPFLPGTAFTTRLALDHLRDLPRARAAAVDLERFRAAAADDPAAAAPADAILAGLRDRDVLLVFVESYGRAALENRRFAPTVTATLAATEARLASRGLAMRSGWLTAPTVAGQSWLSHASLLTGLHVADQGEYRALLETPRRTLMHLAGSAGWRTVAVMPGTTRAWPEADFFGYDRVLAADDLGYRGPPFGWVTMPDQFTLAAFERAELGAGPRPPVFAEIALISSHAPWTPIAPLIPWEAVGDGSPFDALIVAGDPPEVVWRDPDRVREQYRQALDYALRTVGGFAERHAAAAPLIVVLGDHQPAAFVSEDPVGRDVPVHLIGPPEVLELVEGWGWSPGLLPGAEVAAWPMDAFRDRFLEAFAAPSALQAADARASQEGCASARDFTEAIPVLMSCP